MSSTTSPTLGHFVSIDAHSTESTIDVTQFAQAVGFRFPYVGMSQQAYFEAVDVPGRVPGLCNDNLMRQLMKLVWWEARKVPTQSCVAFTVCKPPSFENPYVNRPLSLIASIEQNQHNEPMLIITTAEEAL